MEQRSHYFDGAEAFVFEHREWVNREAEGVANKDARMLLDLVHDASVWIAEHFTDPEQPVSLALGDGKNQLGFWDRLISRAFEPWLKRQLENERNSVLPYYWTRNQLDQLKERVERHIASFDNPLAHDHEIEDMRRQIRRAEYFVIEMGGQS